MVGVAYSPVDPGEVVSLDPHELDLGERLRPIDTAWATAIGQSMKRDGQIHAVDVRWTDQRWQLAGAGGHRVTGARLAGIPIEARVVEYDQAFARRREAAENLFRRANDPIERAEAIAELVRLHRERAGIEAADHRDQSMPKRLRAEAEGTLEIVSNVYGWSEEIGAEIGFTGRTVRNDLFLYRSLQPSVVHELREAKHPVLKNAAQLRALAKLDPARQARAAGKLLAGAKSVSEAIRALAGSNSIARSTEDKRLSAFIGAFQRMGLAEKRGALEQLAGMLPTPFKLVEDK
jgi:ParB family chromosome partitioning protein